MIKVLHINTLGEGGAANAAIRLHKGLLKIGLESFLLTLNKTKTPIPRHYTYLPKNIEKLRRFAHKVLYRMNGIESTFRNRPSGFEIFTMSESPYELHLSELYKEADIINLHWVANFIDFQSFFRYNDKPIVWTLHDANPFTGGCHYFGNCTGYLSDCANCPQLEGTVRQDYAKASLLKKIDSVKNIKTKLAIIAPSKWLYECSIKSQVLGRYPHYYIPYGVDETNYKPLPKDKCRDKHSLPKDKIILLFVSHSIDNKRKGYAYIVEALSLLKEVNDVVICKVGRSSSAKKSSNEIELGFIEDETVLAEIYSAADLFIIPSIDDNLPNTVIESLMCGTPVVGFRTGGIPDMISDGENGYICQSISPQALADTIKRAIRSLDIFERTKIAESAKQKYSLHVQAASYRDVYEEIALKP